MARYSASKENVGSGHATPTDINAELTKIANSNNDMLSRKAGDSPNTMDINIDMNSNRIINLAAPSNNADAARWIDVTNSVDVTGISAPSLTGNANKYLKVDSGEASLSWSQLDYSFLNIDTFADVRTLNEASPTAEGLIVKGDASINDGGGGIFIYDSADTTTADDDDIVIVDAQGNRWKRVNTKVKFAATQDASTDPNTLDDYEEGTWTPSYGTTGTGFTTMTHGDQDGLYTKIGRAVFITCRINTNNVDATGATGFLTLDGLPFTNNSTSPNSLTVDSTSNFSSHPYSLQVNASGTAFFVLKRSSISSGTGNSVPGDLTAGANSGYNEMIFSGVYFV